MSDKIKAAISEGLYLLAEIVNMGPITDQTVKVWAFTLRHFTPEEIAYGFGYLLDNLTSDHFHKPLPGDIKKIIEDSRPSQSWAEAFTWLMENVHPSPYSMPVFPNETIRKAFDEFGGRNAIVNMKTDDLKTHKAQFRGIYQDVEKKMQLNSYKQLESQEKQNYKKLNEG